MHFAGDLHKYTRKMYEHKYNMHKSTNQLYSHVYL